MTRQLLSQGVRVTTEHAALWLDKGIYYVQKLHAPYKTIQEFDNLSAARAAFHAIKGEAK
jgi:hypothetical protein